MNASEGTVGAVREERSVNEKWRGSQWEEENAPLWTLLYLPSQVPRIQSAASSWGTADRAAAVRRCLSRDGRRNWDCREMGRHSVERFVDVTLISSCSSSISTYPEYGFSEEKPITFETNCFRSTFCCCCGGFSVRLESVSAVHSHSNSFCSVCQQVLDSDENKREDIQIHKAVFSTWFDP